MANRSLIILLLSLVLISCTRTPELTLDEIAALTKNSNSVLIEKTQRKPWNAGEYVPGKVGGIWYDTILSDPKTFNQLIAERDGSSSAIISMTLDYLVDYDHTLRQWSPHIASWQIETDADSGTLTVHYTIRDDAFWSYYGKSEKIPVTSDDFVFWYNEIAADEALSPGGYESQCCTMPDGTEKHIDCIKIDDKNFDFVFPRVIAEPMLSTNMNLCPSFIFRPAKEKNGAEGVKNLFGANVDPKTIPSCGKWYITEYTPAQRLVFTRNPYYWEKDSNGTSLPYQEQMIYQVVGDMNTDYLLFKQGKTETFLPRPEEVSDLVENQKDDYTVFNSDGSMGAMMWSFNQNPENSAEPWCGWFSCKQFRQAMSCLLNRDRIIDQAYRGLAEPKYSFFPEANPYYDSAITLQYRYSPDRAVKLLESVGFFRDAAGIMRDSAGNAVEFDLSISSSNTVINDIALIIADECSKVGIKVNVRQIDFQKQVEMLTSTYDWQATIIGLGTNLFPSQGSNVWPSYGNLHLWNPCQETPYTDWEARIDRLYKEGSYTNDYDSAKKIWDEYQRILLEQCPVIYLVRSRSFYAIRNKWNLENFYYDNKNGAMTERCFIR